MFTLDQDLTKTNTDKFVTKNEYINIYFFFTNNPIKSTVFCSEMIDLDL